MAHGWMKFFNPLRLTGAIFDKELRVAGRRRRNYVLRCAYVTIFTILVALVWLTTVPATSSGVTRSSSMWMVGTAVIITLTWFQFLASQVLAVAILSTAISDEIYHNTLGLLMTTPISSVQIVLGKLLSRLLQIIVLLGVSLPLLAIVRVFGGIPWDYVLCALCVTLTTALFYASLSLFLSIFSRCAYAVVIAVVLAAAVLFILLPVSIALACHDTASRRILASVLPLTNPYVVMDSAVESLLGVSPMTTVPWLGHCIVSLGGSVLLGILSTIFVRRAALRQASGGRGPSASRHEADSSKSTAAHIRRVTGSPVFWKERRVPLFGKRTIGKVILALGAAGLLAFTYIQCLHDGSLADEDVQIPYVLVFSTLGILVAAVLPATCITSEKESRTWPILLATPISDWDILWGKFFGAIRRSSLAWLLLLGHVAAFTAVGIIHPIATAQLVIIAMATSFFLCGTGLYFSTRFRHTTTTVIANLALAASLWIVIPLLLGLVMLIARYDSEAAQTYMDTIPIVQVSVVTAATIGNVDPVIYHWVGLGRHDMTEATWWLLCNLVVYMTVGLAFAGRAGMRLRRNPFG
jgi:ABC-type transport system involved in multi-copper enzyme maturation permease subunit